MDLMSLDRVNPTELPKASGFSHAVVVHAPARLVFLAGQTGYDPVGQIAEGGIAVQFEHALRNLLIALRAAGGGPENLASLTVYCVDLDDYRGHSRQIGAAWRRLAGSEYPAMAAIGVSRLWDPAALVELQGCAVLPD